MIKHCSKSDQTQVQPCPAVSTSVRLTPLFKSENQETLVTMALKILQNQIDSTQPKTHFGTIIEEIKLNLKEALHPEMYDHVMMTLQQALTKLET